MRLLRRLRSWLWLVLLLAGPPTALIHFVGWPLPHHWPQRQEWNQWVADPLTRPVIIDLFAIGMWLLWAVLLYAVITDITTRVRRVVRAGPRLPPLPATMQAAASGILGAAVFGTGTAAANPPATAPVHPPTPAAATHNPAPPPAPPTTPADGRTPAGAPPPGAADTGRPGLPRA